MSEHGAAQTWARVSGSWLGHRAEPLIHERLWACPLIYRDASEAPALDGWKFHAGFDSGGRAVAWRAEGPDPAARYGDHVGYAADTITMVLADGTIARTDRVDGRPIRTTYTGTQQGEETYHYDDASRLIRIEEADVLWATAMGSRYWTGGELAVEHDERGPVRITGEAEIVWERVDTPWQTTLGDGARAICDGVVAVTAHYCRTAGVPPDTEVHALMLSHVDDGGLHPIVHFGAEQDRQAWLAAGLDPQELACRLWYLADEGLAFIDGEVISEQLDAILMREASLKQPENPHRAVLSAAARLLARRDWTDLLTPTDDFVVYIAEHDEDFAPKHQSVRAVNPPERVARWDARWPAGVPRD